MNTRKSILEKRSKKVKILIALMFLSVMSPKAWGYAQKELPSTSSEKAFSSNENVYLSRAILTDEKGAAICQVNLVENPEFLPQFAEAGSTNLRPLDLPECEEQNLDIVAQYADQVWIKRDVAIAPAIVGAGFAVIAGSCAAGATLGVFFNEEDESLIYSTTTGGVVGGVVTVSHALTIGSLSLGATVTGAGAVLGAMTGLVCSNITSDIVDRIFYD